MGALPGRRRAVREQEEGGMGRPNGAAESDRHGLSHLQKLWTGLAQCFSFINFNMNKITPAVLFSLNRLLLLKVANPMP